MTQDELVELIEDRIFRGLNNGRNATFIANNIADAVLAAMGQSKSLYTAEDDSGEMIDTSGDGGFTVWRNRSEAQGAIDSNDDGLLYKVVQWARLPAPPRGTLMSYP